MANPTGTQNKTEQAAGQAANKAKDTASNLADKARDTASNLADRARDAASSVASTAGSVASNLGGHAEDAMSSVGSGARALAGTLRDRAPQEGVLGNAASYAAGALDSSGRYLEEHGFGDIGADLSHLIRRNPIPAVLVGVGFGFLLARMTRS